LLLHTKALAATGKLAMAVLAIGGGKSFGTAMADVLRFVATDVTPAVIAKSGHCLMEEGRRAGPRACPLNVTHERKRIEWRRCHDLGNPNLLVSANPRCVW